jgi:hypothetical protein
MCAVEFGACLFRVFIVFAEPLAPGWCNLGLDRGNFVKACSKFLRKSVIL